MATALVFTEAESTWPDKVTTEFVELTEIFVTLDGPMSEASFALTWAVISRSLTWASGDSLVRQEIPSIPMHNVKTKTAAALWGQMSFSFSTSSIEQFHPHSLDT